MAFIDRNDGKGIEVLFERVCDGGFDDLYFYLDGAIKSRVGYSDEEVAYFKRIVESCREVIIEVSKRG